MECIYEGVKKKSKENGKYSKQKKKSEKLRINELAI